MHANSINAKLMNVTYIINEPIVEFDHCYKFGTIKNHLLTEISELVKHIEEAKVCLLFVDSPLSNQSMIARSSKNIAFSEKISVEFIEADNVITKVQKSASDILIHVGKSFEIKSTALQLSYKRSPIDRQTLPSAFQVDLISKHIQPKTTFINKVSGKDFIKRVRRKYLQSFATHQPLCAARLIDDQTSQYKYNLLIALDCFSNKENMFDYIDKIVQLIPEHVGIILAEDDAHKLLHNDDVEKLRLKYINIQYVDYIPCGFEFLSSYMDGVIAQSDSVLKFYSALWGIQFFDIEEIYAKNTVVELLDDVNSLEFMDQSDYILNDLFSNVSFIDRKSSRQVPNYKVLVSLLDIWRTNKSEIGRVFNDFYQPDLDFLHSLFVDCNIDLEIFEKNIANLNIEIYPDTFKQNLAQAKCISFDMFDTIVERDLTEPVDLFFMIECDIKDMFNLEFFNFKHFRQLAEENKRRECDWKFEVTFNQIYEEFDRLTAIFNKKQIEIIKQLEIKYELDFIRPKNRMVRELNISKLFVDYVSIISDIYYSNEQLIIFLNNCNITGYDKLFSSGTFGYLKYHGQLFREYMNSFEKGQYSPSDFLHVGDNPISDGKSPISYGMKSVVYNKSIENYRYSSINTYFPMSHAYDAINQSLLTGLIANKYFSNHQNLINFDSLFSGRLYNVGYMGMGPLLLGFTQWLYNHAQKNNLTTLYFLARDGWMLKQYFEILYPNCGIETKYLYCSRRAFKMALVDSWDDIVELFDLWFDNCLLKDLLFVRFELDWKDIPAQILKKYDFTEKSLISRMSDRKRIFAFLKEISPIILKRTRQAKQDYLAYLNQEGLNSESDFKNLALVDIGYGASMQLNFMKLFNTDNINGYYLVTRNIHVTRTRFKNCILEGFLANHDDAANINMCHDINKYVQVIEAMLSSPEGTLASVKKTDDDFEFSLVDVQHAEQRINRFRQIEKGAIDFVKDVKERHPEVFEKFLSFSPIMCSHLLMEFFKSPLLRDADIFSHIEFEDDLTHSTAYLVQCEEKQSIAENIKRSAWKEGAAVINDYYLAEHSTPPSELVPRQQVVGSSLEGHQSKTAIDVINRHSMTAARIANKHNLTAGQRMVRKFKRNPYLFFNDSKISYVKKVSYLFKPDTTQEKLLRPIVHYVFK